MTRTEFEAAARADKPVRLANRSLCYYNNEWYRPIVTPEGAFYIDSSQERQIRVEDGLLSELQEQSVRTSTVADLIAKLGTLDPDARPIVPGRNGGYDDVDIDRVTATTIAVDAGAGHKGTDTHGPQSDTRGAYDPEERAVMVGGATRN